MKSVAGRLNQAMFTSADIIAGMDTRTYGFQAYGLLRLVRARAGWIIDGNIGTTATCSWKAIGDRENCRRRSR
jgi:hypothetical protein